MKQITMADVAKLANVSKSTVSQYLNKRYDYMSEETKKRIAKAIDELGYQPNFIARSLKQKSTATIGVIVFNILHMLTTQVLRAIEDVCQERDFHVIVCNTDDDPEKEKKYIEMLRAKQVDGLIIFPTGKNLELYEKMAEEQFPLVFVDRMVPGIPADAILLDNHKAAALAVNHLVEHGYERIGIVAPPIVPHVIPRLERIEGFKHALAEKGLPVMEEYMVGMEISRIKEGLTQLFSSDCPPEALFAINDLTLMEILNFVKDNNIRIPDDLALISIDDVPFSNIYTPTLTTIAQPTFEMGKKAAERLFMQIDQKNEHHQQILRFPPTLIQRGSVKQRM
ncbi:LacI family DNA-binding transcriptional regulator [Thermaerobacillus caldiproteolyticus]|uniref:LacI family DNA-binding transcriptional regulator n=1 Tax=Thermaerobacillus caldiproteolyticus TaxID=247480 RepID=UPI00188B5918|nr:substrate-binding domain-containing protein [Anoxybacillus caldiproteolyticus]QPA32347.1 substrate-binding domain-containing protein [Anoxybacillus caldiproteolyticus]